MRSLTHPVTAGAMMPRVRHLRLSWRKLLIWLAGGLALVAGLYFLLLWPWMSRWGATPSEVAQPLPGDDLISDPALVTTKEGRVKLAGRLHRRKPKTRPYSKQPFQVVTQPLERFTNRPQPEIVTCGTF